MKKFFSLKFWLDIVINLVLAYGLASVLCYVVIIVGVGLFLPFEALWHNAPFDQLLVVVKWVKRIGIIVLFLLMYWIRRSVWNKLITFMEGRKKNE